MKSCFAASCEDQCDPSCDSYICKKGATEGAPVPGTDGKVCYGKLVLPQSREIVMNTAGYTSVKIDPISEVPWSTGDSYFAYGVGERPFQTYHLIRVDGISASSRNTPLGIVQYWGFVMPPFPNVRLIFEFGFVKFVSSQAVKVGISRRKAVQLDDPTFPLGVHRFSFGAPNDLWGIPLNDIKNNTVYPSVMIASPEVSFFDIEIWGAPEEYPTYHQFFYYRDGACLPPSRP